jgi:hypothetical protein
MYNTGKDPFLEGFYGNEREAAAAEQRIAAREAEAARDNMDISGSVYGDDAARGAGKTIITNSSSKSDALISINSLPSNIQANVKRFFKGSSNLYSDFTVEQLKNGNHIVKMSKPGKVPGSKAIYYKEIDGNGKTIKVFKETYDPSGNLIHIKDK